MNQRRPAIVVLAAGRGMRFHGRGHKLVQQLDGAAEAPAESLLARTVRHALATRLRVVVVTTQALVSQLENLLPTADVVVLPELNNQGKPSLFGMGHSIAAGVGAAGDAEGWLILPGDMPRLRPASMLAVADAILHYPVAYAQHLGHQGHPVGFGTELYSELIGLQGDQGARRIVARYPSHAVNLDDPGVLIDVDTVEDLTRLMAQPPLVPGKP